MNILSSSRSRRRVRRAAAIALVTGAALASTTTGCEIASVVVGDDTDLGSLDASSDAPVDASHLEDDAAVGDAATDAATGDAASEVTCPTPSPPAPSFCDGGPIAPRYDANGCIIGYACAPTDCVGAGGACVGLAPGACPSGNYGDVTKYTCGGGAGVGCCLP